MAKYTYLPTYLPKERFKTNQNDLIYYFKSSSTRKRFEDFNNGIKLFEKLRLVEMKLPNQHMTPQGRPCRNLEGPNSQNLQRTFRDSQGTNTKTDYLMKRLFFRSNSLCIKYLFLFFTGRANIQKL